MGAAAPRVFELELLVFHLQILSQCMWSKLAADSREEMARSANSDAFSGSRFFGQPIIDFEYQPTAPFSSSMLEDHRIPSSATSGLHQKLDRIIACNEEQKLARQ